MKYINNIISSFRNYLFDDVGNDKISAEMHLVLDIRRRYILQEKELRILEKKIANDKRKFEVLRSDLELTRANMDKLLEVKFDNAEI